MSEPPNDADPADSSSSPTESRTSAETCGIDALRERLARLKGEASCVAETSNDSWSSQPISSTAVSLLDCKLPSPPPKSPEGPQPTSSGSDFRDANPECVSRVYQRATSHPVGSRETGQPQDEFPGARSLSPSNMDPYTWSCTWVDLPSPFGKVETQLLIPPLQKRFHVAAGRFVEGEHWEQVKGNLLGEGAFGQCYLAQELHAESETPLSCVKVCRKEYRYEYDELLALSLGTDKPEIVEFYGATVTPGEHGNQVHIFMEYMLGGSVEGLLEETLLQLPKERPVLKEPKPLDCLCDVLSALQFLHERGMVHNDVKGANVLLCEEYLRAKLADFGSATSHKDSRPNYDIWAAGCFLIEMLEGKRPAECTQARLSDSKFSGTFPSCAGEDEQTILTMCFSRGCTAAKIIRCLNNIRNKRHGDPSI